jgi:Cysteine-rich secretory protein family
LVNMFLRLLRILASFWCFANIAILLCSIDVVAQNRELKILVNKEIVVPPLANDDLESHQGIFESTQVVPNDTYSIGDPSPQEQFFLELLNRSRANPVAESNIFKTTQDLDVLAAFAYFKVDLDLMRTQFNALAPRPPFSFHASLNSAADRHSQDMRNRAVAWLSDNTIVVQSHTGSDGSTATTRIVDAGYAPTINTQHIFGASLSTFYAHSAFDVDWGNGTGGMISPAIHRINNHTVLRDYREIGIGIVEEKIGIWGPQFITQNFASRTDITPMITGVAYIDLNKNNFYDPGEGVKDVTLTSSSLPLKAVTSRSGGYSIPVPYSTTYPISHALEINLAGFPTQYRTVTFQNANNVKLDIVFQYEEPQIFGPTNLASNNSGSYQISQVPGSSGYVWRESRVLPSSRIDGAEEGLIYMDPTTYNNSFPIVVDAPHVASGSHAFRLAHLSAYNVSIGLKNEYIPTEQSFLNFKARVNWATDEQFGRVYIKNRDGFTRLNWELKGNGGQGDLNFTSVSLPLASYANQVIRIYFAYDMLINHYEGAAPDQGFFFDDIQITNASELINTATHDELNNAFIFTPTVSGQYAFQSRAKIGSLLGSWGPVFFLNVTGSKPPPPISLNAY